MLTFFFRSFFTTENLQLITMNLVRNLRVFTLGQNNFIDKNQIKI